MAQGGGLSSVLIVVAHPDDEVLGCGATAAMLTGTGQSVTSCILSGAVEARGKRPDLDVLRRQAAEASAVLGMREPILGSFPNIALNTVPTLELVQFVERAIEATRATTLITHHPADLNDDHLYVSRACQAAARLAQRRAGLAPLEQLLFMEVPSSTDWAFPGTLPGFTADTFVPVTEAALDGKLRALACYDGVMRPSPHPRRAEVIRALAVQRGAQAGAALAEAFQSVYRRWRIGAG